MIADDRKRSQSRLLHSFRTAEVSKFKTRKNHGKQNGGRRERNFGASKFIIPLVNRF